MAYCLPKNLSLEFKRRISSGDLNPEKLSKMTSEQRNKYFSDFLGKDNAINVNALLERKLLLKNWQRGLIEGIKSITGMKPQVRQDLISRIQKMDKILNPSEEKQFMKDLANKAIGFEFTKEEAKGISDLSTKMQNLKSKANEDGIFLTENSRLEYGMSQVVLKKYIDELKLNSKEIKFKEQPLRNIVKNIGEIPGVLKSSVASFDNSFWGRQGIKNLWDYKTAPIWGKNFLKSWRDIGKQLTAKGKWWKSGDDAVMDSIKADILSRPNAVNGKYKAGDYGLNVMGEEAFPSSIPEKIPLFGRLFKASEVAYNGAALRLRADLADRIIKIADDNGINTLDPKEAKGLGMLVSSSTGRGSNYLKLTGEQQKAANVALFSLKFLESNIDTLTAPLKYGIEKSGLKKGITEGEKFASKQSAQKTMRIVGGIASVLTIAKLLDKESVETDPRSPNFGKVKIFGHWTDITGGMGSLVTLASRLTPTYHDGKLSFWTKNQSGEYRDLLDGKYGANNAMDVFEDFFKGKLSPVASILRDIWTGKNYDGEVPTFENITTNAITPLPLKNSDKVLKDPASSFPLGSIILDAVGFSVSSSVAPNEKTKLIPLKEDIKNEDLISAIQVYAQAMGTDPETAFNRIFSGQKINRVTNGTVIVDRMSLKDSTAVKKSGGGNNPEMKLDHTIPLELGGSNNKDNLKLVPTAEWKKYTAVENALGKALKAGKLTKDEVQKLIIDFKNGKIQKEQVLLKAKISSLFGKLEVQASDETSLYGSGNRLTKEENQSIRDQVLGKEWVKGMNLSKEQTAELSRMEEELLLEKITGKKSTDDLARNPDIKKQKISENVKKGINKAAEKFGVPSQLLFDIALQESHFNTGTVNKTEAGKKAGNPTGLFQFTDSTWKDILNRYNDKPGMSLHLPTKDRTDPETNAMAAAYLIKNGQLGKWDASEDVWGKYYSPKELEELGFYKQSKYHKKGVRASVRLAQR